MVNNFPQSYGPPTSPATSRGFAPANSPGALDMYSSSADSLGYVTATSPQPSGFPSIAVSATRQQVAPPSPNGVADMYHIPSNDSLGFLQQEMAASRLSGTHTGGYTTVGVSPTLPLCSHWPTHHANYITSLFLGKGCTLLK